MVLNNRRVSGLVLGDGRLHSCDHVVSTMPLTLLARQLAPVPGDAAQAIDALTFRNTILVYLHVDAPNLFPDQWLYVHSPDLGTGRVSNFRNWVPELYGDAKTTILVLEYWCYDQDPIWSAPDDTLTALATQEIRSTGLLRNAKVLDGHVHRIKRCYPVYRQGYKEHLARVVEHVKEFRGLTPIGRYGSFKYNNQDHSILMGILAAENILQGRDHDLWAINTDYEYQEAAQADTLKKAA
jgi:protoporphyrinogen oxidase